MRSSRKRLSTAQTAFVALEEKKISLFESRLKQKAEHRERQRSVVEDEDYHFFMSALPTVRQIAATRKLRFRMEFYELLAKYTREALIENDY